VTIKDIAAMCGVSVSTVSRVMNNHPYVKDEVREKVLKVIEQEHFVPHDGAVDLVKAKADSIGLVVRGMGNEFFNEMIPILEKAINDSGYEFYLTQIHSSDDELRAAAALAKAKGLKGVILLGGRYDYSPDEIAIIDVPFVCCTFTSSFGKASRKKFSSVCIDDEKAARDAVEYLIEKGHKRIAIVLAATADHSISELRYRGYCKTLEEHGIEVDESLVVETGGFSMEAAYEEVKKKIESGVEFTAAFAISDSMAVASMKALDDAGRKVPTDCSVIAIDGMRMTAFLIPTLTTFVQPREDMAAQSVKALKEIIETGSGNSHVLFETEMRSGASVAAPKC